MKKVLFSFIITGHWTQFSCHVISQLSHSCACSMELDTMVLFIIANEVHIKHHTGMIVHVLVIYIHERVIYEVTDGQVVVPVA